MSRTQENTRILLARRPHGAPKPDDFRVVTESRPEPGEGEVLVETLYLSIDPYMRGRMNDVKSYVPPYEIGGLMGGGAVGRIVKSCSPDIHEDTIVEGMLGWQQFAVAKPRHLRIVDPRIAPISTALGILGMPGLTAYFGLLELCKPQPGETVVVSAASGAVGSVVGQLAKLKGCRTIGFVGSEEKAAYVKDELGYDATLNYRVIADLQKEMSELCPDGVDVYFDNVGGPITDAVLDNLSQHARVALCGQISQYNNTRPEMGPRNLWKLIVTRSRVEGFLVTDFGQRYAEGISALAGWLADGTLRYREDIVQGIESAPAAFIRMLEGENFGKLLVRVDTPE